MMWLAFALIPTSVNTENNTTRKIVRKFKDCMYDFFLKTVAKLKSIRNYCTIRAKNFKNGCQHFLKIYLKKYFG
ncbi:MAG: hypothetical protein BGO32_02600 [Bacteroidetes bacterium 37-13]|nr:MAG: hypothetical protein BGO32_02600 [Bacteroidetes bacterium 37-13]